MENSKAGLEKCPTTEQLLKVLADIGDHVLALNRPAYERLQAPEHEAELMRRLCLVLTALGGCGPFWNRLWLEGATSANELIDLTRVHDALGEIAMAQLGTVFCRASGTGKDAARHFVDRQLDEIRSLYYALEVQQVPPATLLAAKEKARAAVRKLADEICGWHRQTARQKAGADLAEKFRKIIQSLFGAVLGSIAASPPLLPSDAPAEFTVTVSDPDDRAVLLALSAVALLSLSLRGEPQPLLSAT